MQDIIIKFSKNCEFIRDTSSDLNMNILLSQPLFCNGNLFGNQEIVKYLKKINYQLSIVMFFFYKIVFIKEFYVGAGNLYKDNGWQIIYSGLQWNL